MPLTTAQLQALKADILADPVLAAVPMTSDGAYAIADAYKVMASPDYYVWKSHLDLNTIMENGFDWVQVDNLTVGQARIWEWLFSNEAKSCNPSKTNVRAGIAECWKGTSAKEAVRDVVLGHAKRKATRSEKLFATGAGTRAAPSLMGYEPVLTPDQIQQARELP